MSKGNKVGSSKREALRLPARVLAVVFDGYARYRSTGRMAGLGAVEFYEGEDKWVASPTIDQNGVAVSVDRKFAVRVDGAAHLRGIEDRISALSTRRVPPTVPFGSELHKALTEMVDQSRKERAELQRERAELRERMAEARYEEFRINFADLDESIFEVEFPAKAVIVSEIAKPAPKPVDTATEELPETPVLDWLRGYAESTGLSKFAVLEIGGDVLASLRAEIEAVGEPTWPEVPDDVEPPAEGAIFVGCCFVVEEKPTETVIAPGAPAEAPETPAPSTPEPAKQGEEPKEGDEPEGEQAKDGDKTEGEEPKDGDEAEKGKEGEE